LIQAKEISNYFLLRAITLFAIWKHNISLTWVTWWDAGASTDITLSFPQRTIRHTTWFARWVEHMPEGPRSCVHVERAGW